MFKNLTKTQILGFGLIVLSWVFWGLILVVPFLNLGLRYSSIVVTILLIGSNIFWLGAFLAGKELLSKFNIFRKQKGKLTNDCTD